MVRLEARTPARDGGVELLRAERCRVLDELVCDVTRWNRWKKEADIEIPRESYRDVEALLKDAGRTKLIERLCGVRADLAVHVIAELHGMRLFASQRAPDRDPCADSTRASPKELEAIAEFLERAGALYGGDRAQSLLQFGSPDWQLRSWDHPFAANRTLEQYLDLHLRNIQVKTRHFRGAPRIEFTIGELPQREARIYPPGDATVSAVASAYSRAHAITPTSAIVSDFPFPHRLEVRTGVVSGTAAIEHLVLAGAAAHLKDQSAVQGILESALEHVRRSDSSGAVVVPISAVRVVEVRDASNGEDVNAVSSRSVEDERSLPPRAFEQRWGRTAYHRNLLRKRLRHECRDATPDDPRAICLREPASPFVLELVPGQGENKIGWELRIAVRPKLYAKMRFKLGFVLTPEEGGPLLSVVNIQARIEGAFGVQQSSRDAARLWTNEFSRSFGVHPFDALLRHLTENCAEFGACGVRIAPGSENAWFRHHQRKVDPDRWIEGIARRNGFHAISGSSGWFRRPSEGASTASGTSILCDAWDALALPPA